MPEKSLKKIEEKVRAVKEQVIALRREFHTFPELSGLEKRTSARVAEELKKLGIPVKEKLGGYGVMGFLAGEKAGQTIALRADMDALPVEEKTGLSFASKNKGIMHACGHDGHTAILLGTAAVLKQLKKELKGNVKFFFQPAEEGPGGALPMIQAGVMENPKVSAVLSLHLYSELPPGKVGLAKGPMMASADEFSIILTASGGHAAAPYQTVDLITLSAHLILALQTMTTREFEAVKPLVVSIGKILGGEKSNILPKEVRLEGTVRSLEEKVRQKIKKRLVTLSRQLAKTWGAKVRVKYRFGYPVTVNDPEFSDFVLSSLQELWGKEQVKTDELPRMGAEDFSYFAQNAPGVMLRLGGGKKEEKNYPHHSPYFDFDESALEIGVASMVKVTLDYLKS